MLNAEQMRVYGESYRDVMFQLEFRRDAWKLVNEELEAQKEKMSCCDSARKCLDAVIESQTSKIQALENAIVVLRNFDVAEVLEHFWDVPYSAPGWSGEVPRGATVVLERRAEGDDVGCAYLILPEDCCDLYGNKIHYVVA